MVTQTKSTPSASSSRNRPRSSSAAEEAEPAMAIDSASGDEDEEEEGEDYEVEGIVDHRKSKGGWLFLVKWVGYDDEENTWEPEDHMQPETVKSYWQSLPNARQPGRQAQHEAAKRGHASTSKSQSPIVKEKVRTLPGSSLPANVNLRGGGSGGQPASKQPKLKEPVAQPSSSSASAKKRAAEAVPVQEEEEEEEEEYDEVDEEVLDDQVDDETWNAMEKAWKDKYDPMDSWEDVVLRVNTLEREPDGQVLAYLDFPDDVRLIYPLQVAKKKCPQHLLSFYEAHLRFKDPKRSQSGLSSTGLSARR